MDKGFERVSTGVDGLDEILHGGPIARSATLIRGGPGQGKTTLGLHFLAASADKEAPLFIGFQESEEQLRANAASVGLDVSGIRFLSLAPDEHFFTEQQGYDVFAAPDVEQEPLVEAVVEAVTRHAPTRVFVDSLTQLRFLSADVFQYRKQVLSFLRYLRERGATVLFSSESSAELPDDDLQFISDGVITLESGPMGSSLQVTKFRGSGFRRGPHQMRVSDRGLTVFPRPLPPLAKTTKAERLRWRSGAEELDAMLNGGLEAGTVTLITGPSGIGKSTLASMFVSQAAAAGHRAAVYLFEEEMDTYLRRSQSLQIDLRGPQRKDQIAIEQVEPMRYLADEFAMRVRQQVEDEGVELVVLDSIAGFQLTLDGEEPKARLHALAKSLARTGVSVFLINEIEAMSGQFRISERGISYLSDNVVFLRYVEVDGQLKRAIGVLKKRLSAFDTKLHEYQIARNGLVIGEPIHGLTGVMMGVASPHEEQ